MSISEVSHASSAENPFISDSSDSSKPKFKCSLRSIVSNFSAKRSIFKPKPLDIHKNDHSAASNEATTSISVDRGGALSLSVVHDDLLLLDSAFADAKKYMDHVNLQINQLHEKLEELEKRGSSEGDLAQLWKAIAKLKMQIPSQMKIRSSVSNPRHNRWPNINNAEDEMMHFFYKEPKLEHTSNSDGLLKAFYDLPEPLRYCLLCFFKFPQKAIIKRRVMIYLWIGQGFTFRHLQGRQEEELHPEENVGNQILDELIAKGFLEPVYQKCSLMPDSCRMSLSVRSSLSHEAEVSGFTSNNTLDLDSGFVGGCLHEHSCLINVGEAIIDGRREIFENMKHVQSLYLGRWQSSAEHHIEMADAKILHGLKKLNCLKFLSLQGISLIRVLPLSISELIELKILDLRACHNLEMIPDKIGFLKNLTHLDMSECYFLARMPESLAQLSNLEVLKGFFIGHYDSNKRSCSLDDLTRLSKLRKLNIYTSVNDFPTMLDLESFRKFEHLQKLTISWGGCSLQNESIGCIEDYRGRVRQIRPHVQAIRAAILFRESAAITLTFPSGLQKLELHGFPETRLPYWLSPEKLNGLKKLYIRGGKICDIGQFDQRKEQWPFEILKLKYLSELTIEWRDLQILFPKLIYLHKVECPKLTNFPCDESGVWMNKETIDTDRVQLPQQFTSSTSISSSSNLGTAPTIAQDDCKVSPIDEKKL